MTLRLIFKNISSSSAKRLVPCYADLPHRTASAMNSVRIPVLFHAEGIVHNFPNSSSLQSSTGPNWLQQDVTAPPASPLCVISLDKFMQSRSISRETMDVPVCAGLNASYVTSERNVSASELSEEPHAELYAAGRGCVTAEQVGSVTALTEWLKDRLPSGSVQISQWGSLPGTKNVANLWLELSQGEISLEDSRPPKRTVNVACVKITNGSGKVLLESHQEMADGSRRERNRPLSEKMKPGEAVEEACLRGINEELGSELGAAIKVTMLQDTYNREVQQRESFSYPGLLTCYILHYMEVVMKHLPADDFVTDENELCDGMGCIESFSGTPQCRDKITGINGYVGSEVIAIGVKRHFWKWVPENLKC